jgi:hypothetical protein
MLGQNLRKRPKSTITEAISVSPIRGSFSKDEESEIQEILELEGRIDWSDFDLEDQVPREKVTEEVDDYMSDIDADQMQQMEQLCATQELKVATQIPNQNSKPRERQYVETGPTILNAPEPIQGSVFKNFQNNKNSSLIKENERLKAETAAKDSALRSKDAKLQQYKDAHNRTILELEAKYNAEKAQKEEVTKRMNLSESKLEFKTQELSRLEKLHQKGLSSTQSETQKFKNFKSSTQSNANLIKQSQNNSKKRRFPDHDKFGSIETLKTISASKETIGTNTEPVEEKDPNILDMDILIASFSLMDTSSTTFNAKGRETKQNNGYERFSKELLSLISSRKNNQAILRIHSEIEKLLTTDEFDTMCNVLWFSNLSSDFMQSTKKTDLDPDSREELRLKDSDRVGMISLCLIEFEERMKLAEKETRKLKVEIYSYILKFGKMDTLDRITIDYPEDLGYCERIIKNNIISEQKWKSLFGICFDWITSSTSYEYHKSAIFFIDSNLPKFISLMTNDNIKYLILHYHQYSFLNDKKKINITVLRTILKILHVVYAEKIELPSFDLGVYTKLVITLKKDKYQGLSQGIKGN